MRSIYFFLFLLFTSMACVASAFDRFEVRTFTSKDGSTIEAKVDNYNPATKTATLRLTRNNRKYEIPLARFSEEDQAYLKKWRDEYDRSFAKVEFMTMRLETSRVVFIIDRSGSMNGDRWDKLLVNLEEVIKDLDPIIDFNFITFGSDATVFRPDLVPATEDNRIDAIAWLQRQRPGGGTNLTDAMREAVKMKETETFIVLSDGAPTGGGHFAMRILDEFDKEREKPFTVHTVSYETDSGVEFMKQLAEAFGGGFVRR